MEGRATSIARYREITRYGSRICAPLWTTLRVAKSCACPGRRWRGRRALRLSHRVEHRRVHRFRGGLARPHHELERGKIALAGMDGAGEHGFALRGRVGESA